MLDEYQTAILLVADILDSIQKVEETIDLAVSLECPNPLQAAMIKKGGKMACDLMRNELEAFKNVAAESIMKQQGGITQA